MLSSILIHNIVLIDRLQIKFHNNFSVLTGETGSGKSILLDSLGLAIGYRSNNRLIRKGSDQGMVVAQFDISGNQECKNILLENGLIDPEDENVLILRRILLEGSSKAFVNDIAVGVGLLANIGSTLIEIHGQHEQSNLLDSSFHRKILDQYANSANLLIIIGQIFDDLANIKKELQKLHDEASKNEREKDYLIHIIKELEDADVQENEEETLTNKRNLIISSEKISNLISEVLSEISEADNKIFSASRLLIRNQNLGNFISEKENKLEILTNILDEISSKNDQAKSIISQITSGIGRGDDNLDEIEERLFLVRNLSRKFNIPINDLPSFLDEAKSKLAIVQNFTILAGDLEGRKIVLEKKYLDEASKLSKLRKEAGEKLIKKVQDELKFLKMPAVKFSVKIEKLPQEQYGRNGADAINFAAATNASSNLDDISKIASGGELSRFMLALKVAFLEIKSTPTLIFDEIDSGIGGAVANAVGDRLKLLAKNAQILVVTHHPQIAAKADNHLRVEKTTINEITKTQISILNLSEKEQEVARMLSAENVTDESLAAARKLMEQ